MAESSAVGQYISKCVVCKRARGSVQEQKIEDLAIAKLKEEPPFTYTGVDLFGPFYIKEKRLVLKRYGVSWRCLSSKAANLETLSTPREDFCAPWTHPTTSF